jgi:ribosomal protein S18 acetylase RimI-like enzyme
MSSEFLMTVRRASAADVESLSAIGSEAFFEAYSDFNEPNDIAAHLRDQYSPEAIVREIGLPDRFYLLALVDAEPAGLCKVRAGPAPEGIPDPACLEIQQLYVDPRHQRRGIGKVLVDAVLADARSLRFAGVWLGVWQQAAWAINFYTKYGFMKFGLHTFRLGSTEQTDLPMWISAGDN